MASANSDIEEIARRYANALFDLAESKGAIDAVADDLKSLRGMLKAAPDLRLLTESQNLPRKVQQGVLEQIGEKAGFNALTNNFLGLLARNRRLSALDDTAEAFLKKLALKRGETEAVVTVARALTDSQEKALTDAVKAAVGAKATLSVTVDPAILGGMIVKLGSKMIDSSLRTKLGRLQTAMKG